MRADWLVDVANIDPKVLWRGLVIFTAIVWIISGVDHAVAAREGSFYWSGPHLEGVVGRS